MHKDGSGLTDAIAGAVDVDRRTVNRAMAWSVPVIVSAAAAPATSTSPSPTPSAQLGTVSGAKGSGSNKQQVTFSVTLVNVVGSNSATIKSVSGTDWSTTSTLPTPSQAVTPTSNNPASFMLIRGGTSNNPFTVDVTVTINGVAQAPVTVSVK